MLKNTIVMIVIIAGLMSCNGCNDKKTITDADIAKAQQDLIKENKKQHEKEMKAIARYVEDQKWPMEQTKTGLYYWVYEKKEGPKPVAEDLAVISYTITLLDGTKCYETTDANPKVIVVEHDNVETGLHEAIQLMHTGEKAKFILPSHLAFGFTGDSGKIPPNASVVYDIHLIAIR